MSIILKRGTQSTYSITTITEEHYYTTTCNNTLQCCHNWDAKTNFMILLKYLQILGLSFPVACSNNIFRLRNTFSQVLVLLALVSINTLPSLRCVILSDDFSTSSHSTNSYSLPSNPRSSVAEDSTTSSNSQQHTIGGVL